MKTILIALDYNANAVKIAESGFILAKALRAKVLFLHVISDLAVYSEVGNIKIKGFFAGRMNVSTEFAETSTNAKELAQDFLNKVKFHLGNNKIQIIIKESNSDTMILETAEEFNADFIVMGTHNRQWPEDEIIGTTTQKALLNTTIPLFIVPIKKRFR